MVWLVFVWLGICLVWVGWAWLGVDWRGLVLFGIRVKLIYQISLLVLDGGGWGKSKLRLNPAWAEFGNNICLNTRVWHFSNTAYYNYF